MPTPPKSTRTAPEKNEFVENLLPFYTKNVERLADLQKKSLELAAEENAEFMDTCKKAFHVVPETPGFFWFDLLNQTFERFVETEKGAIDLAVEQTHAIADIAKDRGTSGTKVAEGITGVLQQSVERSVAMQKKMLDYYAEQQKTAYDTAKKQFRMPNNPMIEAFQTGLDSLIETQKIMLDMASKPLKRSAAA